MIVPAREFEKLARFPRRRHPDLVFRATIDRLIAQRRDIGRIFLIAEPVAHRELKCAEGEAQLDLRVG